MALVQLAGYAAFIFASLVLGTRLVLLSRRTRELPELVIGVAFLLGGALGYTAWLAIGVMIGTGAPPEAIRRVATAGLAFTVLGTCCNGVGTAMIFRAGKTWARVLVACAVVAMVDSWIVYALSAASESSSAFWQTVLSVAPLHGWAAIEAIAFARVLRKRARFGLADPLIADRTMQYGLSSAAVVVSIAVSVAAQLVFGPKPPTWTAMVALSALLVGAGSIWLGFFPPDAYRARVARAFASD